VTPARAGEPGRTARRCAFLSMASLADFVCDDELACEPFRARGWEVETVDWRRAGVDWRAYGAVIIRSAWDYQSDPEAFLAVLAAIERAGTPLANSARLVRWNLRKSYLHELAARAVRIVPTLSGRGGDPAQLQRWRRRLASAELVVKPLIGANAGHTYRIGPAIAAADFAAITAAFADRDYLVQPFMQNVIEEGEYSLFYLGGAYSHAILKTPGPRDFRVQEEHGGVIRAADPEPALRASARSTLAALPEAPLYARADFVRDGSGSFALMELELIEPSLYLRMDAGAPERFARAFADWYEARRAAW
jgi:glutathione synthase/RimK-type ligase-like ATP-grasp enzyme